MAASREARVGAFVLAGLIIAGVVVFLIGDERRLFERHATFHAVFRDVEGLKTGAPVRFGGIDIGTVGHVGHGTDPADTRLYVDLNIVRDEAVRVRDDTVASIANKGLLGDKMIELHGGTPTHPQVPEGGMLKSDENSDLTNLMTQVGSIAKRADQVLEHLETTTRKLSDDQVQADLQGTIHSVNIVLKQVAEGDGYVHRLLADPKEADRLSRSLANLDQASAELSRTMSETRKLVERVNQGPGFAHDVLYGDGGNRALAKVGDAAGEVATTLKGIRDGNGMAHALLFGGDAKSDELLGNLNAMSGDLRKIVADVRSGKGTLGALLVDPSIYEDMKTVLGNVERNDVLRALVRYSIKQDEKRPGADVKPAAPGTKTASP